MFPVFDGNQSDRTPQSAALKVLFGSAAAVIAGGVALMFFSGAAEMPIVIFFFIVAMLAIAVSVVALIAARMSKPKTKRGLEGLDLYSVIDRLVNDLDDDEAAYLQRRLDEREAKHKNDLTVSIDDLLEQRSHGRGARDQ